MATVKFDAGLLGAMLQLGAGMRIVDAKWLPNQFGPMLELELRGPDVPACERADLVFTQTFDATQPRVILTAAIKPTED